MMCIQHVAWYRSLGAQSRQASGLAFVDATSKYATHAPISTAKDKENAATRTEQGCHKHYICLQEAHSAHLSHVYLCYVPCLTVFDRVPAGVLPGAVDYYITGPLQRRRAAAITKVQHSVHHPGYTFSACITRDTHSVRAVQCSASEVQQSTVATPASAAAVCGGCMFAAAEGGGAALTNNGYAMQQQ
jgi:hypothetical protein